MGLAADYRHQIIFHARYVVSEFRLEYYVQVWSPFLPGW